MCHLAIIYPYLVPIIDKYVFEVFSASAEEVQEFTEILYNESKKHLNYEGLSYAVYFALKYNLELDIDLDSTIRAENCIYKTMVYLYFKNKKDEEALKVLKSDAEELSNNDFDQNWIYIYEILSESELTGDWKKLKKAKVSFLIS